MAGMPVVHAHAPGCTHISLATCALTHTQVVSVDMMYKTFTSRTISNPDRNVFYAEASGQFRAVRLPYKGTRLSAIAVLPASSRYGLDARAAAAAIRADTLLASRAWMPQQRIGQLKLQLPRFSVRTSEVALTQVRMQNSSMAVQHTSRAGYLPR